jgi:hypothetical protein
MYQKHTECEATADNIEAKHGNAGCYDPDAI